MRGENSNLADLIPDSLLVRSADGVIRAWNTGSQQLYGWTAEQAIYRKVDELLASNHPFGLDYLLDAVERDGQWHGEIYRRTADGRELCIQTRWRPRRDDTGAIIQIDEWRRDTEEGSASEVAAHRFTNLFHAMAGFSARSRKETGSPELSIHHAYCINVAISSCN